MKTACPIKDFDYFPNQPEVGDLICDFEKTMSNAEILDTRLIEWNLWGQQLSNCSCLK